MEPLKNMFNRQLLERVADVGVHSIKGFNGSVFLDDIFSDGWEDLELKQRIRRISTVLHKQLSGHYETDVKQLVNFSNALHLMNGSGDSFLFMFLPDYVEQYGLLNVKESLEAIKKITVLSSCEYAIRPFIIQHRELVLREMLGWADHGHASVRRLASEGCRPRLPWGVALPELKRDPSLILPILEKLKDDPTEYVRRSVANNLNDIAKDNPEVVLTLAAAWRGGGDNTDWIAKHGCRTLLKRADPDTLIFFGLSTQPKCSVSDLLLAKEAIVIGDHLQFSFSLVNEGTSDARFRVEYCIDYMKANGKTSKKVFKITENIYAAEKPVLFSRRQSFADMTTRKHYQGKHSIAITVNGMVKAEAEFEVMAT